jgi:formylglycine-generating enzyme required for sulfatase activity
MKQKAARGAKRFRAKLLTWVLLCAACVLALWPPGGHSRAQRRDRQLMQTGGAASGKRLALVIGNGAYRNAPVLKNPPNDARDMAETLSRLGFTVEHGVDLDQRQMKSMIRQFGQKLKAGGQGVFYYAGHGVQSKGRNYLIPVDAVIESEADVEDAGMDVQLLLNYMDDAQNGLNIVILDACRNNPFARSMRSAENGLAQVDAPTGTLIAYATAPGKVASDGAGKNGLYTSELLKQMMVPGLSVTDMFMRVRAEVVKQTGGKQVPWEASSLIGSFSFNEATGDTASKPSVTLKDAEAVEAEYWEAVKNSTDAADYQGYLKEYPQGRYAQLARLKLRQLEAVKGSRNEGGAGANTQLGGDSAGSTTTGGTKAAPRAGVVVRNQMGMEFAYVPAGSFMMGSENGERNEKPVHQVTFREGFYMGRYEVTQAQWQAEMKSNPSHFKECGQCPVERVSWDDAQKFIRKLNARGEGYAYRLPTESEWEYACRAGTTMEFAYGSSLSSEQANFDSTYPFDGAARGTSLKKTTPVGNYQPNNWGLYDMHGNVWEWCEDWYHENYSGAPTDGSAWLSGGEQKSRVLRGGSWNTIASQLRSALRNYYPPDLRFYNFGVRLVAVPRT